MEVADFFADYLHHRVTTPVEHQGKGRGDRPTATLASAIDRAPKTPGSEGAYTLTDGRVALPAMSLTNKEQKQLQDTVLNSKASAEERLTAVKKLSDQGVKSLDVTDANGHTSKARLEVNKIGNQSLVHLFLDSDGKEKVVLRGLADSHSQLHQQRDNHGRLAGYTGKGMIEFSGMHLAAPQQQQDKQQDLPHPQPTQRRDTPPLPSPDRKVEPPKPLPQPDKPPPGPDKPDGGDLRPPERKLEKPTSTKGTDAPAKVFELNHLENRSANHNTPDALVRLPEHFDPSKPINVMIYNHGFRSNVRSSFAEANMEAQMRNAPPNTVLIMPEWQANAGSSNGNMGRFAEPGRFKAMMQEVFDKTPGLAGKSVKDINELHIVAHSAGYKPSESEIYNNGLESKVKSVTLLDALYDGHGFDRWLKNNIADLSAGSKRFTNIYSGTSDNSQQQAARIKQMLRDADLSDGGFHHDRGNSNGVLEPSRLAGHSIVFKYSQATTDGLGAHMSLPNLYVSRVLKAQQL